MKLTDDQINDVLWKAKVPEPPEGWKDYDMQVAQAVMAAVSVTVMELAARVCEEQAKRFSDDRGGYVARECAAAIRARGQQ